MNYNIRDVRFLITAVLSLLVVFTSCNTLNPDRLYYNDYKERFELISSYGNIPVRTENLQLVDSSVYEEFMHEMYESGYKYPLDARRENVDVISNTDKKISDLYNAINKNIRQGDFNEVFEKSKKLRALYKNIDLYSDIDFLEGFSYAKLGLDSIAGVRFQTFLDYSEKKYSLRLRGYELADTNDILYTEQRNFAKSHFSGEAGYEFDFFKPIPFKYYNVLYQPGFSIAGEMYKSRLPALNTIFGTDYNNELLYGLQYSHPLNEKTFIYFQGINSKSRTSFAAGLPRQLYKSEDNRAGIKVNPEIRYSNIRTNFSGSVTSQNFFNFGINVSAGYFISPTLSLGGYYQYFVYNQNNPFKGSNYYTYWNENEMDVSIYLNLLRNISLKAGYKNTGPVFGLFMSGMEVSFNLKTNSFYIRTDIF